MISGWIFAQCSQWLEFSTTHCKGRLVSSRSASQRVAGIFSVALFYRVLTGPLNTSFLSFVIFGMSGKNQVKGEISVNNKIHHSPFIRIGLKAFKAKCILLPHLVSILI